MTRPTPRRRLVLLAPLAALTGCGGLLPQPAPPPKLYRLTAVTEFPANLPRIRSQLLVNAPTAPGALDTARIALSRNPLSLDYFADAAWSDRAPLMVQSLLVDSLENSGRVAAVAKESLALRADFILQPELRHFEAVYGEGAAVPEALVTIGLKLVRMPDRAIVAQRAVEGRAAAMRNDVPAIIGAFNAAFAAAAQQAVAWSLDRVAAAPHQS